MEVNLFTQYYLDYNLERQNELFNSLISNTLNKFKNIILLVENDEVLEIVKNNFPTCQSINIGKRASFNDFFAIMDKGDYSNDINILSNSDIFFDDLDIIKNYIANVPTNTCLALSRYDYHSNANIVPFLRADSQDTWIFNGNPKVRTELEYGMGIAGCISGDATIQYNRGKRTGSKPIRLDDLYMKFNNIPFKKKPFINKDEKTKVLSYDIQKNRLEYKAIKNVIQSGVKETIKIKFEDNTILQLTKNHRILDENGIYKEAEKFCVGEYVMSSNSQRAIKIKEKRIYRKRIVVYIKYHPYAENKIIRGLKYKRVKRCRLVLEANLNNIKYDEFVEILRNNKNMSEKLKYYDPKLEVHHKNMDTTCDDLDNLEITDKNTHAKYHANQDNFNFIPTNHKRIISIEDSGNVMTYDIEMESEPHNFVINSIIVHNCDNRLAYDIQAHGYNVINPCHTIKTYHLHNSNIRNYLNDKNEPIERIPQPYLLVNPI